MLVKGVLMLVKGLNLRNFSRLVIVKEVIMVIKVLKLLIFFYSIFNRKMVENGGVIKVYKVWIRMNRLMWVIVVKMIVNLIDIVKMISFVSFFILI